MAKPELASLPLARDSNSDASTRHPSSGSSNRVNRAPRSRTRYSSSSPSAAILALLATFSASPLVSHAYPLEPPQTALPFLYPPSLRQSTPSLQKRSPTPSTSNPVSSTTTTPPSPPSGCSKDGPNMPDKYVMEDDGLWYKTVWSLYGSTYCPVSKNSTYVCTITMTAKCFPPLFSSQNPCSPPSSLPELHNDINSPPALETSPSLGDFDMSTLPTGWTYPHTALPSHHGTVVIIALSVALSVIIMTLMLSFVFWRRRHRPNRDPEKKGRRTPPSIADDDNDRVIREVKARQRKWFKAASRWRENVRFSARRRRTARVLASTTSYSTLSQEEKSGTAAGTETTISHSRSSSPTATPRSVTPDVYTSSRASIRSSHSQIQTTHAPESESQTLPTDPPPSSPLSPQPPAYHSRSSYFPPHDLHEFTYTDCSTSKAPLSLHTQPRPHDDADGHVTPLSGHVATDDKTVLSRRTALASAPPESDSNVSQSVSVPLMEDEDMFELPPGLPPSSPTHDAYDYEPQPPYSPPTSLLPPPPSKGKQKFDYSHDWDISLDVDNVTVEPQLGPSAPPLEESEVMPSAPPIDSDVHVPSAPPLDAEDDCPEAATGGFADEDDTHAGADMNQIILQHMVTSGQPSGAVD